MYNILHIAQNLMRKYLGYDLYISVYVLLLCNSSQVVIHSDVQWLKWKSRLIFELSKYVYIFFFYRLITR